MTRGTTRDTSTEQLCGDTDEECERLRRLKYELLGLVVSGVSEGCEGARWKLRANKSKENDLSRPVLWDPRTFPRLLWDPRTFPRLLTDPRTFSREESATTQNHDRHLTSWTLVTNLLFHAVDRGAPVSAVRLVWGDSSPASLI